MVSTTHKGCDAFAHVSISTLVFFTQRKSWHMKLFGILCTGSFFVLLCILIFISDIRAGSYRGLNPSLAFPLCFAVELNICGTPALAGSASPGTHCCAGRNAEKTCNFLFGSRATCGIDRLLLYYRSYLALIGGFAVRSFHFWIFQLKWARTLMAAGAVVMIISLCCNSYFRVFMVYLWWKVQCCLSTCVNLN